MIAVVRLYRQHDMDLITLFYNDSIHLCKLMKKVLVNYTNGDEVPAMEFDEPASTEGYIPKCIRMHIRLNENNVREKAAIDLLQSMKSGYRCSFLKALFRNSCAYLPMIGYTSGSAFLMRKLKSEIVTPVKTENAIVEETVTKETVKDSPKEDPKPVITKEDPVIIGSEQNSNESTDSLDALFQSFNQLG